jgi:hypothetical protein
MDKTGKSGVSPSFPRKGGYLITGRCSTVRGYCITARACGGFIRKLSNLFRGKPRFDFLGQRNLSFYHRGKVGKIGILIAFPVFTLAYA